MPRRSLLLCGTPRTGSTRLCELLRSTGVAGRPESWFRAPDRLAWARTFGLEAGPEGEVDPHAFAAAAVRAGSTPDGVFAARIMWGSMEPLVASLATPGSTGTALDVLADAFGPPTFVHVVRLDVVAQAVSWARAEQTGHWQDGDATSGRPVLDLDLIDGLVGTIRAHDRAWRAWFHRQGVEPVTVSSDEIVEQPDEVVERILTALAVEVPPGRRPTSTTTRQADALNEEWARRYRASRPRQDERRRPT